MNIAITHSVKKLSRLPQMAPNSFSYLSESQYCGNSHWQGPPNTCRVKAYQSKHSELVCNGQKEFLFHFQSVSQGNQGHKTNFLAS